MISNLHRTAKVLLLLIFGQLWTGNTFAKEKLVIDLRTGSQDIKYAVGLAAESPKSEAYTGHAFVIWYKEDATAKQSVQQAIGFYPTDGSKKGYDLVLQFSGGKIYDDSNTKRDQQLVVLMDKSKYELTRTLIDKWSDPGKRYGILLNDCVSFVEEVAVKAGLKLPSRVLNAHPAQYLKALIEANRSTGSVATTRLSAPRAPLATIAPPATLSASVLASGVFAAAAAGSCTKDRIHGSYSRSCSNCRVEPRDCLGGGCDRLECTCNISLNKARGTAKYLRECNECQFWNQNGHLQCGDG